MAERVLAGRYVLEQKIGTGGMGTVWKGTDRLLGRTVAVKLLHEGLAADGAFSERFRREARSAASLGHPNIVTVYDTGEADEPNGTIPFIVMEYVQGESLHQLLSRQGPLPVEDTARIASSILSALGHAHSRGLVHRDMKPANVLFDANTRQAKVVDFGIAKGLDDTGGLTKTSGLIGTAAYLSPEQVDGHNATPASDLYAVGCLLYACLAGEPPFTGNTPVAIAMRHLRDPVPPLRSRRPDVPESLDAAITRSLEKDPARRFASAQDMQAAIDATGLAGLPASAPTVMAAAPTVAAVRDHPVAGGVGSAGTEVVERATSPGGYRWLPALTAFLVVAAAAAVTVLWLQNRPTALEEAPLPTATPLVTAAPTEAPTPAPTPSPTAQGTDAPRTARPSCANLPGLDLPCPDTPPPTQPPATPTPPASTP